MLVLPIQHIAIQPSPLVSLTKNFTRVAIRILDAFFQALGFAVERRQEKHCSPLRRQKEAATASHRKKRYSRQYNIRIAPQLKEGKLSIGKLSIACNAQRPWAVHVRRIACDCGNLMEPQAQPEVRSSCAPHTQLKNVTTTTTRLVRHCKDKGGLKSRLQQSCRENTDSALLTRRFSSLMAGAVSMCGHGNKRAGSFRYGSSP